MDPTNVLGFLLSILAGAIAGVAILPIASDSIRGRLFGEKKALLTAKNELYETVQAMILSGQVIGDHTQKGNCALYFPLAFSPCL